MEIADRTRHTMYEYKIVSSEYTTSKTQNNTLN